MKYLITGTITEFTDKAVKIQSPMFRRPEWFPKSQILNLQPGDYTIGKRLEFNLTKWIAEQKGIPPVKEPAAAQVKDDGRPESIGALMSVKQSDLIKRLLTEKAVPEPTQENVKDTAMLRLQVIFRLVREAGRVTMEEAGDAIDYLFTLPDAKQPGAVECEGVYVVPTGDGEIIVKIKKSKQSGNLYAMKLIEIGGKRLTDIGEVVNSDYEYVPNLVKQVKAEHKMTLEQAKQFGIRYGKCLKCGRNLKDAQSVEQAIGPVCRKWYGE